MGVVFTPSLLGFVWFSVFGGTALHAELTGTADLAGALGNGYETVLFALFDSLPGTMLLSITALILLIIFFVTSADSAVLVLASMSTDEAGDPPLWRRVVWGVVVALVAAVLLLAGGLDALQSMITIAALPFALLMLLVMAGIYREFDASSRAEEVRARVARRHIDAWIAREMANEERLKRESSETLRGE